MISGEYAKKNCPFCRDGFADEGTLVVCSSCGMPHHLECWVLNGGCTTFGCQGTIQSLDGMPLEVRAETFDQPVRTEDEVSKGASIFCTQCGNENAVSDSFCSNCGTRLKVECLSPDQITVVHARWESAPIDGGDDRIALIGKNAEYYLGKFEQMKMAGKKTQWNWSAFLLGAYWMLYRKMYMYGASALAIAFFLSFFFSFSGNPFVALLMLAVYAGMGLFGNALYMRSVEEHLIQVRPLSDEQRKAYFEAHGGVNVVVPVVAAVVFALVMLLM